MRRSSDQSTPRSRPLRNTRRPSGSSVVRDGSHLDAGPRAGGRVAVTEQSSERPRAGRAARRDPPERERRARLRRSSSRLRAAARASRCPRCPARSRATEDLRVRGSRRASSSPERFGGTGSVVKASSASIEPGASAPGERGARRAEKRTRRLAATVILCSGAYELRGRLAWVTESTTRSTGRRRLGVSCSAANHMRGASLRGDTEVGAVAR